MFEKFQKNGLRPVFFFQHSYVEKTVFFNIRRIGAVAVNVEKSSFFNIPRIGNVAVNVEKSECVNFT